MGRLAGGHGSEPVEGYLNFERSDVDDGQFFIRQDSDDATYAMESSHVDRVERLELGGLLDRERRWHRPLALLRRAWGALGGTLRVVWPRGR